MADIEETTRVVLFTATQRIEGSIALLPGARLTDWIRNAADFVAMTNVVVSDHAGQRLFSARFLDVGRQAIQLIVPVDQLGT